MIATFTIGCKPIGLSFLLLALSHAVIFLGGHLGVFGTWASTRTEGLAYQLGASQGTHCRP